MTMVHRRGELSLHVRDDGVVELRRPSPYHDDQPNPYGNEDPTLLSSREQSINQVCRRYAERTSVDFQVAAAAVLDALETTHGGGGGR
jgi:hypothetical protein